MANFYKGSIYNPFLIFMGALCVDTLGVVDEAQTLYRMPLSFTSAFLHRSGIPAFSSADRFLDLGHPYGMVIDHLLRERDLLAGAVVFVSCVYHSYRLHQPVKNPISDNTNILWNIPSLGINSRYRLP